MLAALAVVLVVVWNLKGEIMGPVEEVKKEEVKKMDAKFLKTSDGVNIAYDLYEVPDSNRWLILVHMMPATRESWKEFAELGQKNNTASLAIDLRGHGQSTGGPDGYLKYTDADHQKSILDLDAAVNFLKNKGARAENIVIVGASIGANLALQYITQHPEIKRAVLLSPGFNYRGIETQPLAKKLQSGQAIWLVAAEDDQRSGGNAGEIAKALYQLVPENVERRGTVFKKGGHGTEIFKAVPELMEKVLQF